MRKSFSGLLLGAAITFAASAASAYTGTLWLAPGNLPPVAIGGSGNFSIPIGSLGANSFVGSGSSPATGLGPITQIFLSITGNASGPIASGPSFSGTLQARGFGFGIPLLAVPLGGKLGFATATLAPVHSAGTGSVSAHFGAWTTGVASVSRTHTLSTAACVASANSAICPTAMLGGATANLQFFGGAAEIVFVAATDLYTTTGAIGGIPTFTVLTLTYIPEPGTLLLLGSGVIGLGIMGKRKLH